MAQPNTLLEAPTAKVTREVMHIAVLVSVQTQLLQATCTLVNIWCRVTVASCMKQMHRCPLATQVALQAV